jgi:ketosteroid isomerase-like protein
VVSLPAQKTNDLETTIRSLEQTVVKGILAADTNLLKEVWAPELLVNTPRNTIAANRGAVFQNQRAGLINYSSFQRVVEQVMVQGDVVITMGSETFVSRNDLPETKAGQEVRRRFTNIWRKKNGKWQQVARHASIICS